MKSCLLLIVLCLSSFALINGQEQNCSRIEEYANSTLGALAQCSNTSVAFSGLDAYCSSCNQPVRALEALLSGDSNCSTESLLLKAYWGYDVKSSDWCFSIMSKYVLRPFNLSNYAEALYESMKDGVSAIENHTVPTFQNLSLQNCTGASICIPLYFKLLAFYNDSALGNGYYTAIMNASRVCNISESDLVLCGSYVTNSTNTSAPSTTTQAPNSTTTPNQTTPNPTTPNPSTPNPTTGTPDPSTPNPTTGTPDPSTPNPTTGTPDPSTPNPTTGTPDPTTQNPSTPNPTTPNPSDSGNSTTTGGTTAPPTTAPTATPTKKKSATTASLAANAFAAVVLGLLLFMNAQAY